MNHQQAPPLPAPADPPPTEQGQAQEPAPERSIQPRLRFNPRTALLLTVAVLALTALAAWLQWRSLRSARSAYQTQSVALARMQADAQRITALQHTPQRAADRKRPNEELLAQIEHALKTANVPLALWQDSIPQPAQRLPQSPYQRFSTRLYFETVTLEQITRFAHTLLAADPSLAVASLHLAAPARTDSTSWNIDLTVSYLVYTPTDRD